MKILLIIFFLLLNISSNAENLRINTLVTIDNFIITNIDLENEIKILKILSSNFDNKIDIKKIALNNLINEMLKKIEVMKSNITVEEKNITKQHKDLIDKLEKKDFVIKKEIKNLIYAKIKLENQWNILILNKYSGQININMQELENIYKDNESLKNKEEAINIEKNKKLQLYSANHLGFLKKNALIKIFQ